MIDIEYKLGDIMTLSSFLPLEGMGNLTDVIHAIHLFLTSNRSCTLIMSSV